MKFIITCPLCKTKHISEQKYNIIFCCDLSITHFFSISRNYWSVLIDGKLTSHLTYHSFLHNYTRYKAYLDKSANPEELINSYIKLIDNLIFE